MTQAEAAYQTHTIEDRNALVMAELSTVYYIAARIRERLPQHVELEDLVNAGVVGLLEASRNFDLSKNAQFKTFAKFRIRGAILDSLREMDWGSRYLRRRGREISDTIARLQAKLGRKPAEEEIAESMGLTPEKVREVMKISQEPISLETPIGEEEDSHLGDFIEDQEAVAPAEAASVMLLKEKMQDVLQNLTDRERKVLVLRFGLEDGHQRTLEEVGQEFGVTRERIRQIEAKALRKLRHPSRGKALKDYWTNE